MTRYNSSDVHTSHACRWIALLGLVGGCSFQNFDSLTNGASAGGSDQSGGTGTVNQQGGSGTAGGTSSPGGTSNTGGAAMGGGNTLGGTSSTAVTSGGADTRGCAFAQTGGQLVVPPSQGFETDLTGWSTTAGHTTALSRKAGNGSNCEGDWYMSCDGAPRSGNWDGPMLEVVSYVTLAHKYQYTVAVRVNPASAAAAPISMKLVLSRGCGGTPVYDDVATQTVSTNWARMVAEFTLAVPTSCTSLTSVKLYVASNEAGPSYATFDVDDFKLIDLTPGATSGSGGASSTGGAPNAGGAGGGAGATGGAPSTGADAG